MKKRIAAIMAGLDKEYQQDFSLGMAEAARRYDVDLCIFNCQGQAEEGVIRNDQGENSIFDLPDLKTFDGVVALCYTMVSSMALDHVNQLLSDLGDHPVVAIDTYIESAAEVTFDDAISVRALLNHLIVEHGFRRFAMVTGPMSNKVAMDRYNISREVLQEHGCVMESVFDGSWTRDGGRTAAACMLADPRGLPEAVVCGNDDMAFGVMEAFAAAGVRVPEDVKVTGFDALQEAVGRGLTTILRPSRDAGFESVNILVEWMNGKRPQERLVTLPTKLIIGSSCGCEGDPHTAEKYMRRLSEAHRNIERSLTRASSFSSSLAGVSGQTEAGKVISNFAGSWGVNDMHVCVPPDFLDPESKLQGHAYPERMLLLASYSGGMTAPQMTFDTRELLPILQKEHQTPLTLVFSPLYYLDKLFGYAVFDLQHATGFELYSVLTLLGGALMSLNLKCTVTAYATALEDMSIHDPLTGLYNRRGYNQLAPALFADAQAHGRCFAVISCDMDDLKSINDEYGHMAGDTAITRMGRALRVLEMDGMTCVHISGDEFIAVGIVRDGEHAMQLAESLHVTIDDMNHRDRWICNICASVGTFAAVPRSDDKLDDFLIRADGAMYRSKRSKKRGG
ncbi:MAG: GGDEF domain-containing protein [Clostridiales bacterium]|nr:GGDEF domain-containing protein [Clostridiales bacterium]